MLELAKKLTSDQSINFGNVSEVFLKHAKAHEDWDSMANVSHELTEEQLSSAVHLKFASESYVLDSLDFDSSGFQSFGLKALPKSIDVPEYKIFNIIDGSITFVDNYPIVSQSGKILTNLGSRFSGIVTTPTVYNDKFKNPPELILKGSILLISDDCWSPPNYCHWLFDWLTRISGCEYLGTPLTIIFPRASYAKWVQETLDSLTPSFRSFNVIQAPPNIRILADNIFVPSSLTHPIPHPGNKFATWAVDFIRVNYFRFNNLKDSQQPLRIFIDRSKSARGSGVIFLNGLDEFLARHKIIRVFLEDLSFPEQVALFSYAELIIGIHGAGFSNLIFCKPGTKVVEIFSPFFGTPAYALLSGRLSLNYKAFMGAHDASDAHLNIAWRTIIVDDHELDHFF